LFYTLLQLGAFRPRSHSGGHSFRRPAFFVTQSNIDGPRACRWIDDGWGRRGVTCGTTLLELSTDLRDVCAAECDGLRVVSCGVARHATSLPSTTDHRNRAPHQSDCTRNEWTRILSDIRASEYSRSPPSNATSTLPNGAVGEGQQRLSPMSVTGCRGGIMRYPIGGLTSNTSPAVRRRRERFATGLSLGSAAHSTERYVPLSDGVIGPAARRAMCGAGILDHFTSAPKLGPRLLLVLAPRDTGGGSAPIPSRFGCRGRV
jgi:hypothetical protein